MKTNIEVNKEFDIFYISFLKNMEEVKGDRVIVPFPSGAIKDFIAQIRQQDRENLVKEIEEKQVELSDKGEDYRRLLGLQEAIEIIKK